MNVLDHYLQNKEYEKASAVPQDCYQQQGKTPETLEKSGHLSARLRSKAKELAYNTAD